MDDLQLAIEKLNARREIAIAKQAEADAIAKREKQAVWSKLKIADPVMADFLTAINAEFGKPAKLKLSLGDEVLINNWK